MKNYKIYIFLIMVLSNLFVSAGLISTDFLEMQGINQTLDSKIDNPINLNILGSHIEIVDIVDYNLNISPSFPYHEIIYMNSDKLFVSVNGNKINSFIVDYKALIHQSFNSDMLNIRSNAEFIRYKPNVNYQF